MKTYTALHPRADVWVRDGERRYLLEHHVHHSPDGYAWGYGGSGPSELAKDILWDLLDAQPDGGVYQAFKFDIIARLDEDQGWSLTEGAIRDWLEDHFRKGEA